MQKGILLQFHSTFYCHVLHCKQGKSKVVSTCHAYSILCRKTRRVHTRMHQFAAVRIATQSLKPSMGRLQVRLRGLTHPWFLEPWGRLGASCRISAEPSAGWRCWVGHPSAQSPYGLIIKQRGFGQETHVPDLMTYISCTTFLLHHLYCLRCTLLGLINIPHLLCNVFSPCETAYLPLACKLHTCQSG